MTATLHAPSADIDAAFGHWEQLRRRLVESERSWADTAAVLGDPQRRFGLRREMAELEQAADEAFCRAMQALDAAAAHGRPRADAG